MYTVIRHSIYVFWQRMLLLLCLSLMFVWCLPLASLYAQQEASNGRIVSRFFQKHSTWYEKIPLNPKLHPNSAAIIANIEKYSHALGAVYTQFSFPIFYARSDTANVTVELPGSSVAKTAIRHLRWNVVPIPEEARPSGFGNAKYRDGHLVVISHDRKYAWDFYQAQRVSATEWKAALVRRWDLTADGINAPYDALAMPKLCPIPHLHGLITPEEIKRGYINHALAVSVNNQKTSYWGQYPCEAYIGGANTNPNPPQGGMRFQLDPSVNIDALGLSPTAKIIAKALQEYGMVSVMNAGPTDFDLFFEDLDFRPDKVSWPVIFRGGELAKIPKDKLRVVAAPRPPFAGFEAEYAPVRVRAKQRVPIYWTPFDVSSPRSTLSAGASGTVRSEPVTLNGSTWWFIDYDDANPESHTHGWTKSDLLEMLSVPSLPPPLPPSPTGLRQVQ